MKNEETALYIVEQLDKLTSKENWGFINLTSPTEHIRVEVKDAGIKLSYVKDGKEYGRVTIPKTGKERMTKIAFMLDVVERNIRDIKRNEEKEFEDRCYEAYQLDWMLGMGYSIQDFYEVLVENTLERYSPEDIEDEVDLEHLIEDSRDALYNETGFCGQMFVCKEEFLTAEYLDPGYMGHLLSVMPPHGESSRNELRKKWEEYTGLALDAA